MLLNSLHWVTLSSFVNMPIVKYVLVCLHTFVLQCRCVACACASEDVLASIRFLFIYHFSIHNLLFQTNCQSYFLRHLSLLSHIYLSFSFPIYHLFVVHTFRAKVTDKLKQE
jgi:hypothetical protein